MCVVDGSSPVVREEVSCTAQDINTFCCLFRYSCHVLRPRQCVGDGDTKKVKKGMFLYSTVSRPLDYCSKRFTLHPPSDLFTPTPFRLLLEAFSHAAITVRRLFVRISISVCSQVLILYF